MAGEALPGRNGRDDVFSGRNGDLRCRRHNKAAYETEDDARRAVVAGVREGTTDPGLEIYPCLFSGTWHAGHRGGWRSLGRLIDEARGRCRVDQERGY